MPAIGDTRAIIVIDQMSALCLAADISAIVAQFSFRQGRWAGDRIPGQWAAWTAIPHAVLDGHHLAVVPAIEEVAEDPAMPAELPIVVGGAFPHAERGKVRWF